MKKLLWFFCFTAGLIISTSSYANWFKDIVDRIEATNAINQNILNSSNAMLSAQRDILSSQKDIEGLMKNVNGSLIGSYGWGTYNFHDYQSYGAGANDWSSVMQMVDGGGGSGALGQVITGITNQFPQNTSDYNRGISDTTSQKYYALKSGTIIATRAASQLDYDKIQSQITYQQMLQQQIEKTKDLKSAVDLNNRIQVESNLINLEILRQSALANQQHAVSDQSELNSALLNARFLTK